MVVSELSLILLRRLRCLLFWCFLFAMKIFTVYYCIPWGSDRSNGKTSTSGQEGITGTGLTLPPEKTIKTNKILEMVIFRVNQDI